VNRKKRAAERGEGRQWWRRKSTIS